MKQDNTHRVRGEILRGTLIFWKITLFIFYSVFISMDGLALLVILVNGLMNMASVFFWIFLTLALLIACLSAWNQLINMIYTCRRHFMNNFQLNIISDLTIEGRNKPGFMVPRYKL